MVEIELYEVRCRACGNILGYSFSKGLSKNQLAWYNKGLYDARKECEEEIIKKIDSKGFDKWLEPIINKARASERAKCEKEISVLRKIIKGNDRCNFEDGIKKGRENLIEEIEHKLKTWLEDKKTGGSLGWNESE